MGAVKRKVGSMTARVYFDTQYKQYHARIYMGSGKYFHVGRFRTKEIAEAKANEMLNSFIGLSAK